MFRIRARVRVRAGGALDVPPIGAPKAVAKPHAEPIATKSLLPIMLGLRVRVRVGLGLGLGLRLGLSVGLGLGLGLGAMVIQALALGLTIHHGPDHSPLGLYG